MCGGKVAAVSDVLVLGWVRAALVLNGIQPALEEVCGAPVQVRLAVAAAPAARPKAAAARPAPAQAAQITQTARQEPQQVRNV